MRLLPSTGVCTLALPATQSQEKGVIERGGSYLKGNALKGRKFNSLEEFDSFLKRWNRTIARLRIHGTTRKQVYTHFLEVEKPALKPFRKIFSVSLK